VDAGGIDNAAADKGLAELVVELRDRLGVRVDTC
jgi:hypothetical protein